ncbi:hypothetical protein CJ030_MR5G019118 [Morella rubra]|uniref:Uncharacterized protein n=1 Tax=Morella rubra TaxID=262757 RepID=A0A6A1VIX0_9ROSI|nr:hypothetical protein CJ030_MR5G019118 [Morella rubra]
MATPPKRSKRLHNFSLPCLKWGDQRFLRCIKVPPNSQPSSLHPRSSPKVLQSHPEPKPKTDIPNKYARNPIRNTENESNSHQETDMIRQTLSLDIGVATESKKLRLSVLEGEDRNSCPWNLRTRRAAYTAPKEEKNIESGSSSQTKDGCNVEAKAKAKTKDNIGFVVRLLKDEVEEDFLKMVGARPPKRPKKRARIVQRKLDMKWLPQEQYLGVIQTALAIELIGQLRARLCVRVAWRTCGRYVI